MSILDTTGLGSCLVVLLGLAAIGAAVRRSRRAPEPCRCPPGKGRPCYACSTEGEETTG